MGIYGSYAKQLMEQNNIDSRAEQMTLEEFKNSLLENYMSVFEQMEEGDTEVVEEGANLDIRKEFKDSQKEAKTHLKAYKTAFKAKDFKLASAELDKASKALKVGRDRIKDVDAESVGSAVLGYFAWGLLNTVELIIPYTFSAVGVSIAQNAAIDAMFANPEEIGKIAGKAAVGATISTIGNIIVIIKGIIILVKDIKTFVKELKSDKEVSTKNFNLYRNKLLGYTDDAIKKIDKLKDQVAKAKAKEEK